MNRSELERMSVDELWGLHTNLTKTLAAQIIAEKAKLEGWLAELTGQNGLQKKPTARRSYPPVRPKFCNPNNPTETWSGRGKQPRWVSQQLLSGKRLDQFLIPVSADNNKAQPPG
jgi:DNA-binding protein H-NS